MPTGVVTKLLQQFELKILEAGELSPERKQLGIERANGTAVLFVESVGQGFKGQAMVMT